MTVVFVNGNPETSAIWGPLVAELPGQDTMLVSPPGFGTPVPDGFDGTLTSHRDWLIERLSALGEPVDLVGHDVGGSIAVTVAMARPDLLRSWASDSLGVFDPEYVWHDQAVLWQTTGAGEQSVAEWMGGTLADRAQRMTAIGFPEPIASRLAAGQDAAMGRAILAFYRSAAQPAMAQWGQDLASAGKRPGLALIGTDDPFVGSVALRRRSAQRAGADIAVLEGLGHRWMVEDPRTSADALKRFWASV